MLNSLQMNDWKSAPALGQVVCAGEIRPSLRTDESFLTESFYLERRGGGDRGGWVALSFGLSLGASRAMENSAYSSTRINALDHA